MPAIGTIHGSSEYSVVSEQSVSAPITDALNGVESVTRVLPLSVGASSKYLTGVGRIFLIER